MILPKKNASAALLKIWLSQVINFLIFQLEIVSREAFIKNTHNLLLLLFSQRHEMFSFCDDLVLVKVCFHIVVNSQLSHPQGFLPGKQTDCLFLVLGTWPGDVQIMQGRRWLSLSQDLSRGNVYKIRCLLWVYWRIYTDRCIFCNTEFRILKKLMQL